MTVVRSVSFQACDLSKTFENDVFNRFRRSADAAHHSKTIQSLSVKSSHSKPSDLESSGMAINTAARPSTFAC
eukprot:2309738-Rhodomonas_salina.1